MVKSILDEKVCKGTIGERNKEYQRKAEARRTINEEMQKKECPVCHKIGTLKPCEEWQPNEYPTTLTTHISIYCDLCGVVQRFFIRHITFPNI